MEAVTDFLFGGSKITAVGDCSHEIKSLLHLGRKAMTKKSILIIKTMVFPGVMYGYESWTTKKLDHHCYLVNAK